MLDGAPLPVENQQRLATQGDWGQRLFGQTQQGGFKIKLSQEECMLDESGRAFCFAACPRPARVTFARSSISLATDKADRTL